MARTNTIPPREGVEYVLDASRIRGMKAKLEALNKPPPPTRFNPYEPIKIRDDAPRLTSTLGYKS